MPSLGYDEYPRRRHRTGTGISSQERKTKWLKRLQRTASLFSKRPLKISAPDRIVRDEKLDTNVVLIRADAKVTVGTENGPIFGDLNEVAVSDTQ